MKPINELFEQLRQYIHPDGEADAKILETFCEQEPFKVRGIQTFKVTIDAPKSGRNKITTTSFIPTYNKKSRIWLDTTYTCLLSINLSRVQNKYLIHPCGEGNLAYRISDYQIFYNFIHSLYACHYYKSISENIEEFNDYDDPNNYEAHAKALVYMIDYAFPTLMSSPQIYINNKYVTLIKESAETAKKNLKYIRYNYLKQIPDSFSDYAYIV